MSTLVALFHNRWSVPILAELHRQRGSRFVTLSRLVGRNPGYGHPLRPEYVLTSAGERIAGACRPLFEQLRRGNLEEIGLKKWSMPVVFALAGGPLRFSELREHLEGVSPRALALALKDLEEAGIVDRRVTEDYPPATMYRLTKRGRPLALLVGAIPASSTRS